ncbi:MAG: hypothetical protein KAH72_08055 [Flavobacteriaceae bacterium]|nr:hypothetical protein [Flavobacteriaceae bacterium]
MSVLLFFHLIDSSNSLYYVIVYRIFTKDEIMEILLLIAAFIGLFYFLARTAAKIMMIMKYGSDWDKE